MVKGVPWSTKPGDEKADGEMLEPEVCVRLACLCRNRLTKSRCLAEPKSRRIVLPSWGIQPAVLGASIRWRGGR